MIDTANKYAAGSLPDADRTRYAEFLVLHPLLSDRAVCNTAIVAALETESKVTETVLRVVDDLVQVLMDTPVVAD